MKTEEVTIPKRPERKFVSENLVIDSWERNRVFI